MKKRRSILLLVLCLGHFAGVLGLIGIETVTSNRPVVQYDLGLHFYRAALLHETGQFPGLVWDPGYMAGYPLGGATNVDNRLGELLVSLLALLPEGSAWNVALIALYSSVPLLVWLGARWSAGEPREHLVAAVLATLLFWGMTSGPDAFLQWGMYGWVVFCASAPLLFGALQFVLRAPSYRSMLALAAATTMAAYAHGLSVVYLPLMGLIVLGRARKLHGRHLATLGLSAVVTAVLVWPIARPILATLGEVESSGGLELYFQAGIWDLVDLIGSADRALPNALLLLCVLLLVSRRGSRESSELALVALFVALVSLPGFMLLPPSGFQPTRNLQAALFLAALPAASVLVAAGNRLSTASRSLRATIAALALAFVSPVLVGWSLTVLGKSPLASEASPEASAMVKYLRETTSPDARILVEDDGDHFGGNHFGSTHLVGYLARLLDRQLIGGPHPVTLVRGNTVTFVNGTLVQRAVAELSDSELTGLLESYNIGTIVVWSDTSRERFGDMGLPATELAGGFTIFRTGLVTGFAAGAESVSATASPNEIRVTGATSSPTLLRWQWDPRMRTEPELPIRAVESPYTPLGFILVDNGSQSEFVVRFDE